MSETSNRIWQTLREIYCSQNETLAEVCVESLASEALLSIDPGKTAPPECAWCAKEHLKQMARSLCRHMDITLEAAAKAALQGDLFSDRLQERYPVKRAGREVYIKRELMTFSERMETVDKLNKVATGLTEHAKVLQRETYELQSQGRLPREEDAA